MDALERNMRITVRFEKGEPVRFLSHLDMQRLLQRALRRANIPLAYSQGFNPHPQLSFATALSVGCTSSAEWLDIKLASDMRPETLMEAVNNVLPNGVKILEAHKSEENAPTLSTLMCAVDYHTELYFSKPVEFAALNNQIATFLSEPIMVQKRTKSGDRIVDIRPMVLKMVLEGIENEMIARIRLVGRMDSAGSLNADLLLNAFLEKIGYTAEKRVHRVAIYTDKDCVLPKAGSNI